MSLVGYEEQNTDLRNISNYSSCDKFQNNKLLYKHDLKDRDLLCPEYLQFILNPTLDIINLKEHIYYICFQMIIGGVLYLSIPLRFMIEINNYEILEDKIYIKIPFNLFFDDLKMIALFYHTVEFTLTNINNILMDCSIISNNILLDDKIRKDIANNNHENWILQLQSEEVISSTAINDFKFKFNFQGLHKGLFIECNNVDNITDLELILNDNDRHIYNHFLVKNKCIKITQHLLYFPFNYKKTYLDRTHSGLEGSINFTMFNVKFNVKCNNPIYKICVYGLGSNKFIIKKGMAMLKYNQDFNNYHNSIITNI